MEADPSGVRSATNGTGAQRREDQEVHRIRRRK